MNSASPFTGVNHLAFITRDLQATIRFYRDLLGLPLVIAMGERSSKHYFFQLTEHDVVAFFAWEEATPIAPKRPGVPTSSPRGFDHLALGVRSKADLLVLTDRLEAAGIPFEGPIDHGLGWSVYFKDPNNIDLELTWNTVELHGPLLADSDPPAAAREGSAPRPEAWPPRAAPSTQRAVRPGVGAELGTSVVQRGLGHWVDGAIEDAP